LCVFLFLGRFGVIELENSLGKGIIEAPVLKVKERRRNNLCRFDGDFPRMLIENRK